MVTFKKCSNDKFPTFDTLEFGVNNIIYASCGEKLCAFDLRNEKVLVNQISASNSLKDEINSIKSDALGKFLITCDDSGEISSFDPSTLQHLDTLKSFSNVFFLVKKLSLSCDIVYRGNDHMKPVGVFSSFDCEISFHDFCGGKKDMTLKAFNLKEVADKNIEGSLLSPPLIYNVSGNQASFLVSTETGHIFSFSLKQNKKPKFIIEAHLGRVISRFIMEFFSQICEFNPRMIVSASNDMSLALWNTDVKDKNGAPSLFTRVEIPFKVERPLLRSMTLPH